MSRKARMTTDQQQQPPPNRVELRSIHPATKNQLKAFKAWEQGQDLLLSGCAGSGKSFIALYLAIKEAIETHRRVILVRSAVPSRQIGYVPGDAKEKIAIYESPYVTICEELTGNKKGYDLLKHLGVIDFVSTSFLRGHTFSNAIVILDEAQNCQWIEALSIVTRLDGSSRFICCGDHAQSDLHNTMMDPDRRADVTRFFSVLEEIETIEHIAFTTDDIVRKGLCKAFLEKAWAMGLI